MRFCFVLNFVGTYKIRKTYTIYLFGRERYGEENIDFKVLFPVYLGKNSGRRSHNIWMKDFGAKLHLSRTDGCVLSPPKGRGRVLFVACLSV